MNLTRLSMAERKLREPNPENLKTLREVIRREEDSEAAADEALGRVSVFFRRFVLYNYGGSR